MSGGKVSCSPRRQWGHEELKRNLTEYTCNVAQLPRWSVHKQYMHGWTGLNANNFYTSSELSKKWHKAKEVNNMQVTRMDEINLMQNTMSKVHEQLHHHHMRLAARK